ncbi:endonuclease/exonuclease/phosphatase family protein [Patescibacteria group bacterium AH-259-L05]|nr:endonuclease/exonuclease/phosphatase family protein [Patescibacteria group bacterium AH-259-L05]
MKLSVRILCLSLLFSVTACEGPTESIQAEPIQLRVLSYNIHHGEGTDGVIDLERIAEIINATNPDIVALQEVDRGMSRTNGVDQPAELARLTGLTAIFEPNAYYDGEYGSAVLTRLPIIQYRNHLLPYVHFIEQRGMLEVELGISREGNRDDVALRLFATHLDFRTTDTERLAEVDSIETIVSTTLGSPMILTGDLNDVPESRTLAIFKRIWSIASDGKDLKTAPSHSPRRQIDYILYHPQDQWKVIEVYVIPETVASDHRPIFAVLEWQNND